MEIKILKTTRSSKLIPSELIRKDEILVEGINQFCEKEKLRSEIKKNIRNEFFFIVQ